MERVSKKIKIEEEVFPSNDILQSILKRLPLKYVAQCRLVCKRWCSFISEKPRAYLFWVYEYYDDFIEKMKGVDKRYRQWIGDGTWSIVLGFEILDLLQTPSLNPFLTREEADLLPDKKYLNHLVNSINGRIAWLEGLVTLKEVFSLPNQYYVRYLFKYDNAIIALREKLITMKQIADFPNFHYIRHLFDNPNAIIALREKLVTIQQIASLPNSGYVCQLFYTGNGIIALRKGLITFEQIPAIIPSRRLFYLFRSKININALAKGLITLEMIKNTSVDELNSIILKGEKTICLKCKSNYENDGYIIRDDLWLCQICMKKYQKKQINLLKFKLGGLPEDHRKDYVIKYLKL